MIMIPGTAIGFGGYQGEQCDTYSAEWDCENNGCEWCLNCKNGGSSSLADACVDIGGCDYSCSTSCGGICNYGTDCGSVCSACPGCMHYMYECGAFCNCELFFPVVDPDSDIGICQSSCGQTWTGNGGQRNCCGDDFHESSPYQAIENLCDFNDNDCDGTIDEGCYLFECDVDGLAAYWRFEEQDTYEVYDYKGDNNGVLNGLTRLLLSMEEINAGTTPDSSGYRYSAEIYGATITAGINGNGVNFDGDDDYLKAANGLGLEITHEITLEAWINPDSDWTSVGIFSATKRTISLNPAVPDDNYQIKLLLNTGNFDYSFLADSPRDGRDIRFYEDEAETIELDYWIEEWDPAGDSIIWVEVENKETFEIYMTYGDGGMQPKSNGRATFELFDDFEYNLPQQAVNDSVWKYWEWTPGAYAGPLVYSGIAHLDDQIDAYPHDIEYTLISQKAFDDGDYCVGLYVTDAGQDIRELLLGFVDYVEIDHGSWIEYTAKHLNAYILSYADGSGGFNIGYLDGSSCAGSDYCNLYRDNGGFSWDVSEEDLEGKRIEHCVSPGESRLIHPIKGVYDVYDRSDMLGHVKIWEQQWQPTDIDYVYVRKYSDNDPVATFQNINYADVIAKGQAYALTADRTTVVGTINSNTVTQSLDDPPGSWYHIALTYDGAQMKLYVNGGDPATSSVSGDIMTNMLDLSVGRIFKGKIDEVAVYSKALTQSEIQDHYNSQKAGFIERPSGRVDNGVSLEGYYDNNIYIGDGVDLDLTSDFSIEAWVDPSSVMDVGAERYLRRIDLNYETPSDYQVKIELTADNFDYTNVNIDGSDVRFYKDKELIQELPYWIQEWNSGGTSIIWVRVEGSGTDHVYISYGDSDAVSVSSGEATFLLFDDFNDNSIDPSKWTIVQQDGDGNIQETNNEIQIRGLSNDYYRIYLRSNQIFNALYAVDFRAKRPFNTGNYPEIYFSWDGSNSCSNGEPTNGHRMSIRENSGIKFDYDFDNFDPGCSNTHLDTVYDINYDDAYHDYTVAVNYEDPYLWFYKEGDFVRALVEDSWPVPHPAGYFGLSARESPVGLNAHFDDVRVRKYHKVDIAVEHIHLEEQIGPRGTLLGKGDSYALYANENNVYAKLDNVELSALLTADWNFITVVHSAADTEARLYVNNVLVDQQPLSSLPANNDDFYIARDFFGGVDEIAVFHKALTEQEIAGHYNSGAGLDLCLGIVPQECSDYLVAGDCDADAGCHWCHECQSDMGVPSSRKALSDPGCREISVPCTYACMQGLCNAECDQSFGGCSLDGCYDCPGESCLYHVNHCVGDCTCSAVTYDLDDSAAYCEDASCPASFVWTADGIQDNCCGDDTGESYCSSISQFSSCYNGRYYSNGDSNQYTCQCGSAIWTSGGDLGENYGCCGDDAGEHYIDAGYGADPAGCCLSPTDACIDQLGQCQYEWSGEVSCNDGEDNDCDGNIDCSDSQCSGDLNCCSAGGESCLDDPCCSGFVCDPADNVCVQCDSGSIQTDPPELFGGGNCEDAGSAAGCSASPSCDELPVDAPVPQGNTCYWCGNDCRQSPGDSTIGTLTCTNCDNGYEFDLDEDLCYSNVHCASSGWTGDLYDCDDYDGHFIFDYWLNDYEVTGASCNSGCSVTGCCAIIATAECKSDVECRSFHEVVVGAEDAPDWQCYFQNIGGWYWGPSAEPAETSCLDGYNNDCDAAGECDYDSLVCVHGDDDCPVEVTGIQVSDSSPIEGSQVTVECEAFPANVNSINATLDGIGCHFSGVWNGNWAVLDCDVGSSGQKEARCYIDETKSYKFGTDYTMMIDVLPSDCSSHTVAGDCDADTRCHWCYECESDMGYPSSKKSLSNPGCKESSVTCTYSCILGLCNAECDFTIGGCDIDKCYDCPGPNCEYREHACQNGCECGFTAYDPDLDQSYCQAQDCNYEWAGGQCCGNDAGESYCSGGFTACYNADYYLNGDDNQFTCECGSGIWTGDDMPGGNKNCCGDDTGEDYCSGAVGVDYAACFDGLYYNQGDDNEFTCNCGGSNWLESGSYCCGDDAGENYIAFGVGQPGCCPSSSNACIDGSGHCQYEFSGELSCDDNEDNDCDGLSDCQDPDCSDDANCCSGPGLSCLAKPCCLGYVCDPNDNVCVACDENSIQVEPIGTYGGYLCEDASISQGTGSCNAYSGCDEQPAGKILPQGNVCYWCTSDCQQSPGVDHIGSLTCTHCSQGYEYDLAEDYCYNHVSCQEGGWFGTFVDCDDYDGHFVFDYWLVDFELTETSCRQSCQTTGCCAFGATAECKSATECMYFNDVAEGEDDAPNWLCYFQNFGDWHWAPSAEPSETSCLDGYNNDCDALGECDYDSMICVHGDDDCPVEVTGIQVSDSTPVEGTQITVECQALPADVNSINATLGGVGCQFSGAWDGDFAEFNCNTGNAGQKEVRCYVDETKSYKAGMDYTTMIDVVPSECSGYFVSGDCENDPRCQWCSACESEILPGSRRSTLSPGCIEATASCTYQCIISECTAECDLTSGGCESDGCSGCPGASCVFRENYCGGNCECEFISHDPDDSSTYCEDSSCPSEFQWTGDGDQNNCCGDDSSSDNYCSSLGQYNGCYLGTYFNDGDYTQYACEDCGGSFWFGGGAPNNPDNCCGDDDNEFYTNAGVGPERCCDTADACIDSEGECRHELTTGEISCTDSIDNDCDGKIDCEDEDCPSVCSGDCVHSSCNLISKQWECSGDSLQCAGNCAECAGAGLSYNCIADDDLCFGDCDYCDLVGGSEYSCVADDGACSGECSTCAGSDQNFNCMADQDECSGNCCECIDIGGGVYECEGNDNLCLGDCDTCTGSGTHYECAPEQALCSECFDCQGSGVNYNCAIMEDGAQDPGECDSTSEFCCGGACMRSAPAMFGEACGDSGCEGIMGCNGIQHECDSFGTMCEQCIDDSRLIARCDADGSCAVITSVPCPACTYCADSGELTICEDYATGVEDDASPNLCLNDGTGDCGAGSCTCDGMGNCVEDTGLCVGMDVCQDMYLHWVDNNGPIVYCEYCCCDSCLTDPAELCAGFEYGALTTFPPLP